MDTHTLKILEFSDVCALLAKCVATSLGRTQAENLSPLNSLEEAEVRCKDTSECAALLDYDFIPPFGGIYSLTELLDTCDSRRQPFEPEQLLTIASTAEMTGKLVAFFKKHRDNAPRLAAHIRDMPDFSTLASTIHSAIHHDATIKDSASSTLSSLRARKRSLSTAINTSLQRLAASNELRSALEDATPRTRNGRPVLAVKSTARSRIQGSLIDTSNTGLTLFIEPHSVTARVNERESVMADIGREENRILWQCTAAVVEHSEALLESQKTIAYLDLITAQARFSRAYRMTAPRYTDSNTLTLRDARHPLLLAMQATEDTYVTTPLPDAAFDAVIPLNCTLDASAQQIIVTGPNTGGKTVTLKTIGLCIMMARAGMHIPTMSESQIPKYTDVMADIGDEQSLTQSLSTFSAHMTNISRILSLATPHTLLLFDELGAGTDPDEGAALATALVSYLHDKNIPAIITTHLSALKLYAYTTPGVENACMEFDAKTLRPTYRFHIGRPGSSNALIIAESCGVPQDIIARTTRFRERRNKDIRELISQLETAKKDADNARDDAQNLKHTLERKIKSAEKEAQQQQKHIHAQLEYTVSDIQKILNEYVRIAQNAPAPWGDLARNLDARVREIADGTPLAQKQQTFLDNLSKGDKVYITSIKSYGIITALQKKRQLAHIDIDGMVYKVPFSELQERPFDIPDTRKKKNDAAKPKAHVKKKKEEEETFPVTPYFIQKLEPGDIVYAPALHSTAKVISVDRDKKTVTVDAKGLPATIAFDKIRRLRRKKAKK